jgi:hypothetical protein
MLLNKVGAVFYNLSYEKERAEAGLKSPVVYISFSNTFKMIEG